MSNIYERLNCITEEAEKIPKNGWNDFSKYKYIQAVDVLGSIRKLLLKYNIHLTLSETEFKRYREGKNFHTEIKVTARFINIDDPKDFHETTYYSVSADTLDKDIFKAKTNGLKYLFTQEFKLVTDDFVDTEQSHKGEKPQPEPISKIQLKAIKELITETDSAGELFDSYLKENFTVVRVEDLSADDADRLKAKLNFKLDKQVVTEHINADN